MLLYFDLYLASYKCCFFFYNSKTPFSEYILFFLFEKEIEENLNFFKCKFSWVKVCYISLNICGDICTIIFFFRNYTEPIELEKGLEGVNTKSFPCNGTFLNTCICFAPHQHFLFLFHALTFGHTSYRIIESKNK